MAHCQHMCRHAPAQYVKYYISIRSHCISAEGQASILARITPFSLHVVRKTKKTCPFLLLTLMPIRKCLFWSKHCTNNQQRLKRSVSHLPALKGNTFIHSLIHLYFKCLLGSTVLDLMDTKLYKV